MRSFTAGRLGRVGSCCCGGFGGCVRLRDLTKDIRFVRTVKPLSPKRISSATISRKELPNLDGHSVQVKERDLP